MHTLWPNDPQKQQGSFLGGMVMELYSSYHDSAEIPVGHS
jgi:hypothetical protein